MFATGATAFREARFGEGSGSIVLDDVSCTGSEERLVDCSANDDTDGCTHSEDAGVQCLPTGNPVAIRVSSRIFCLGGRTSD